MRGFEYLTIGGMRVHDLPEVAYVVEYTSKRNIDKKASQGKDDAVATDKGRHVRELTFTVSWPDIERINVMMGPVVADWDPAGDKGGKPFEWSHERNGLDLGAAKSVRAVLFEEAEGPNVEAGSGTAIVKYKLTSWVKPSAAPGAAKTADEKDKEKSIVGASGTASDAAEALEPVVVP